MLHELLRDIGVALLAVERGSGSSRPCEGLGCSVVLQQVAGKLGSCTDR